VVFLLLTADGDGNFDDGFHNLTSSGQTVGSAIFTQIDPDGDGYHDNDDPCPNDFGWQDVDQYGTCTPTDQCDSGLNFDPNKTSPGNCGCGVVETPDSDNDGIYDCNDECPEIPDPSCVDLCPNDPLKTDPGVCGCGTADSDFDNDGTPDCVDGCPFDPTATDPADCVPDGCPQDPYKLDEGVCGCGVPDEDSDNDNIYDCNDGCPYDSSKTTPGICGCNNPDDDLDGDGNADCLSQLDSETTTFYHTDPTGTPLAITDSEGEVIWQATYLPFGEEYSVDGVLENNRRFIGKEKDKETGLSYFAGVRGTVYSTSPDRVGQEPCGSLPP
jgi:hypothetical protein